jgi:hypothetical protein
MMRIITIGESFLAVLLFISWWGASSNALGADSNAPGAKGIILKEEYAEGSYCHQKLPAIRESSLAGDHAVLSAEETIDFYGPCNQDPLGKDQVHDQRRENTDRRSH